MRLTIIDRNADKIDAVCSLFDEFEPVNTMIADINLATGYDCLITPGNSFGIMDGGFDLVVTQLFGTDIEHRVRGIIDADCHGELNVGDAILVNPAKGHPQLCYAPTMRVPMQITRTDNVYRAMRAALLVIEHHTTIDALSGSANPIKHIITPLLGAGAGNMPPRDAGRQMLLAWESMKPGRAMPQTLAEADAIQARIGLGLGGDPEHF